MENENKEEMMQQEEEKTEELVTFHTRSKDGKDLEMAVIDEFEYKNKNYAVAALVEGDRVSEDGSFIFRVRFEGEEAVFEKITNAHDYQELAEAYMEMEEEE